MHFPAYPHQQAALLPRQQPARGFTLIELLVTVMLSVVLAVIAVPNLQDFSRASQVRSTAKALENGFRFARAEAIRRQKPVIVCQVDLANDDRLLATETCSPFSKVWYKGWVVILLGSTKNGRYETNKTEMLIGDPKDLTKLEILSTVSTSPEVIFTPTGATDSSTNFTLTVSSKTGVASASVITVYPSGLIERKAQ